MKPFNVAYRFYGLTLAFLFWNVHFTSLHFIDRYFNGLFFPFQTLFPIPYSIRGIQRGRERECLRVFCVCVWNVEMIETKNSLNRNSICKTDWRDEISISRTHAQVNRVAFVKTQPYQWIMAATHLLMWYFLSFPFIITWILLSYISGWHIFLCTSSFGVALQIDKCSVINNK